MKHVKQMEIRKEIDLCRDKCTRTEIDYVATVNDNVDLLASRCNSETVGTHYVLKNYSNPF